MRIDIKYEKPYTYKYDIYVDSKKISKEDCEIKNGSIIKLVERNMFLSKFWWLYAIINLICGFSGSFDDYRDASSTIHIVQMKLGKIIGNAINITVLSQANDFKISGVDNFEVLSNEKEKSAKAEKRINFSKKLLIFVPLAILLIIAVVLLVVLL